MKIILATEYFPESETAEITGGVESRAFYVAKQLAKRHKVYVITSRRPGSNLYDSFLGMAIMRVGKPYPYTQTGRILARLGFAISASIAARRLVRKEKIDVVDGYNFFTYPVPIYATLCRKAKGVLTYHEVWVGSWVKNTGTNLGILGELLERKILLLAKLMNLQMIAVSGFTKEALAKAGVNKKRVVVINNGVELSAYSSIRSLKAKQPTVCFIGRLTKNKRVEDLVKAVSIARKKIKTLRCVIVGIGPELDNLRKLVAKHRLSKHIVFVGFVDDHRDVLKILKSSTVFCSPSVVEGFGITMVEAIASGVPFICSDIAPFMEISDKGRGGLHFRQGKPEDLSRKLITMLSDKELYMKCVDEEAALAQKFDWAKITRKIEEIYQPSQPGRGKIE